MAPLKKIGWLCWLAFLSVFDLVGIPWVRFGHKKRKGEANTLMGGRGRGGGGGGGGWAIYLRPTVRGFQEFEHLSRFEGCCLKENVRESPPAPRATKENQCNVMKLPPTPRGLISQGFSIMSLSCRFYVRKGAAPP